MKSTIKVSIGKLAFTLEEEAYQELKAYLDSLEHHFADNPSGREIMEEIENRIAELLQEGLYDGDAVSVSKVREIITKLGSASDMDGEPESKTAGAAPEETPKASKKLYRDTKDKVLGGVCSGLAAYFGKEASLFRILFVVFTLGLGSVTVFSHHLGPGAGTCVLIYLAMWLIIPPAKTVDERCTMRGEANNVDSIRRNIETGAHEIEQAARDFSNSHPGFWQGFARFWQILFGLVLILVAFGYLFAMLMTSLGVSVLMPATVSLASAAMLGPTWEMVFSISIFLAAFLPVIGMLYGGVQGVTGFKSPKWQPGLVIFLLWLAALVVVAVFIVKIALVDPGLLELLRKDIIEAVEDLRGFRFMSI